MKSGPLLSLFLALALPASPFAQVIETPVVSAPIGAPLAGLAGVSVPHPMTGAPSLQPGLGSAALSLPAASLPSVSAAAAVAAARPGDPVAAAAPLRAATGPSAAPQRTYRKVRSVGSELPVISRWRLEARDPGTGYSDKGAELSRMFDGKGGISGILSTLVNDRYEPAVYEESHITDSRYASLLAGSWSLMSTDLQAMGSVKERRSLAAKNALLERVRRGDPDTYSHMVRVGLLSGLLALEMGLPRSFAERLSWAGAFHDLGKLRAGVLDVIKKQGRLTAEERRIIERHSGIGARKLVPLVSLPEPLKSLAISVALHHHERNDGRGYPSKLRAKAIPIEARIVAVADVFDALMENRSYRPGMPAEQALSIMAQEAAASFSPEVWRAFRRLTQRMLGD